MKKKLPPFVDGVSVSKAERAELEPVLRHWGTLSEFLRRKTHDERTLIVLTIIELEKDNPRHDLVRRLISRRYSFLRNKAYNELDFWTI